MGTGFVEPLASAPDARPGFSETLGSAADRRAYFLLSRQKKVAKEKATPESTPGCAEFPPLLGRPGGCATRRCAAQTVLADFPRPACVARRLLGGPQKRRSGQAKVRSDDGEVPFGVPGPLGGAEQRRAFGGSRLALSEPQASLASRPNARVAQGTPRSGAPTQGWLFLWLLSFCHQKESTPAGQRRKPAYQKTPPARQARKPALKTTATATPSPDSATTEDPVPASPPA
jgi:hypothetical protein